MSYLKTYLKPTLVVVTFLAAFFLNQNSVSALCQPGGPPDWCPPTSQGCCGREEYSDCAQGPPYICWPTGSQDGYSTCSCYNTEPGPTPTNPPLHGPCRTCVGNECELTGGSGCLPDLNECTWDWHCTGPSPTLPPNVTATPTPPPTPTTSQLPSITPNPSASPGSCGAECQFQSECGQGLQCVGTFPNSYCWALSCENIECDIDIFNGECKNGVLVNSSCTTVSGNPGNCELQHLDPVNGNQCSCSPNSTSNICLSPNVCTSGGNCSPEGVLASYNAWCQYYNLGDVCCKPESVINQCGATCNPNDPNSCGFSGSLECINGRCDGVICQNISCETDVHGICDGGSNVGDGCITTDGYQGSCALFDAGPPTNCSCTNNAPNICPQDDFTCTIPANCSGTYHNPGNGWCQLNGLGDVCCPNNFLITDPGANECETLNAQSADDIQCVPSGSCWSFSLLGGGDPCNNPSLECCNLSQQNIGCSMFRTEIECTYPSPWGGQYGCNWCNGPGDPVGDCPSQGCYNSDFSAGGYFGSFGYTMPEGCVFAYTEPPPSPPYTFCNTPLVSLDQLFVSFILDDGTFVVSVMASGPTGTPEWQIINMFTGEVVASGSGDVASAQIESELGEYFAVQFMEDGIWPLFSPPVSVFCGPSDINTAIGCIPTENIQALAEFAIQWGLRVGGGISLLLIAIAGYLIKTSEGSPQKIKSGKELFVAAVAGLLFILFLAFIVRLVGVQLFGIPNL